MQELEKYGLPGLIIVLTGGVLGAIIKLIQRNGCLCAIRSCCSTEHPCLHLDCNRGRPGEQTVSVNGDRRTEDESP